MLGRPELVFLDEPTAGMDPQARHATWDLITALRGDGVGVILTTHFMEEAERLADHVVIIDHGRVVADGAPAQLTGTAGQLRFRAEAGLDTDSLLAALPPGSAAKESPAGHYLIEVPGGTVQAGPARRGHGLVRRPGRAAEQPADRVTHARGRLPRADRKGPQGLTGQPITGQPIAGEPVTGSRSRHRGRGPRIPAASPLRRMVAAQAAQETRQLLRNGEQLTLMLIIPLLLLVAFSLEPLIDFGGGYTRIDFLTPGVIALAVMSTAFTSQAIATGFERRYGVLKRLGATPLSRTGLITAKTATVIGVELLQAAIILLVASALGWTPDASPAAVVTVPLLVLLGTAAFSGFALLLAGTLRAEATLAAANLIYVVLLGIGGVVFPLTKFPAPPARCSSCCLPARCPPACATCWRTRPPSPPGTRSPSRCGRSPGSRSPPASSVGSKGHERRAHRGPARPRCPPPWCWPGRSPCSPARASPPACSASCRPPRSPRCGCGPPR